MIPIFRRSEEEAKQKVEREPRVVKARQELHRASLVIQELERVERIARGQESRR